MKKLRFTVLLLAAALLAGAVASCNDKDDETPKTDPKPEPGQVVIDLDFAEGPEIATPALPATSAESLSGRTEYTIAGYAFAVYADKEVNGKYFWVDNSQFNASIPEPNKGLYFSKLGAYVELPALAGKALVKAVYVSTTSVNAVIDLNLTDTDGEMIDQSIVPGDDGLTQTFEPVTPEAGKIYRLTIANTKNAQMARLTLTYDDVQ
ncbi:MAG: hypothetical protein K2K83_03810 [Rikenella sp.]|nr:hypothetical protein [Rikenella sp.]